MSEMKVYLKGLTCVNCAGKIEAALSKLAETEEVSINLMRQEMTLELKKGASPEKMQETIQKTVHTFEPDVEVAFHKENPSAAAQNLCYSPEFIHLYWIFRYGPRNRLW